MEWVHTNAKHWNSQLLFFILQTSASTRRKIASPTGKCLLVPALGCQKRDIMDDRYNNSDNETHYHRRPPDTRDSDDKNQELGILLLGTGGSVD